MSALRHLSGLARRAALPRRTVRLRLTALYGALFLASGAGLLTITNILARGWPWPQSPPSWLPLAAASGQPLHGDHRPCALPAQLQAQAGSRACGRAEPAAG